MNEKRTADALERIANHLCSLVALGWVWLIAAACWIGWHAG